MECIVTIVHYKEDVYAYHTACEDLNYDHLVVYLIKYVFVCT